MNDRFSDSDVVSKEQIILLCAKALRLYDDRLVEHGERVAFIAKHIYDELKDKTVIKLKELLILCIFHDVGAYKTEEIDRMVEFENNDVWEHSVYGYLFLKYFTPIGELSQAVLYHHLSNDKYAKVNCICKDYSNLIHLADRVDILLRGEAKDERILELVDTDTFCKEQVDALRRVIKDGRMRERIADNSFKEETMGLLKHMDISTSEAVQYLKMLVFTIDFKSENTVVHSITTTETGVFLADAMGLKSEEIEKIYFAALVHDIGKLAIPEEILEFQGQLTTVQMEIMRSHVEYTEKIIKGVLPYDICQIAVRHHEKLDGTGYPRGLNYGQLDIQDRILAIADIYSALTSKRSYKEIFDKDKTLHILNDMAENGLIDKDIVSIANTQFDCMQRVVGAKAKEILKQYESIQAEYLSIMKKIPKNRIKH